jgi:large subunit ribosomal protein L41
MKPSQPLLARLRLTTKQVNGGYYKGNRTGSMGFFLKSSTYIIDSRKTRKYIVPESLPDFKVSSRVFLFAIPDPSKKKK